jgi:hypothetical protein
MMLRCGGGCEDEDEVGGAEEHGGDVVDWGCPGDGPKFVFKRCSWKSALYVQPTYRDGGKKWCDYDGDEVWGGVGEACEEAIWEKAAPENQRCMYNRGQRNWLGLYKVGRREGLCRTNKRGLISTRWGWEEWGMEGCEERKYGWGTRTAPGNPRCILTYWVREIGDDGSGQEGNYDGDGRKGGVR